MDKTRLDVFVGHLQVECDFCLRAYAEMKDLWAQIAQTDDTRERVRLQDSFWYSAQAFLTASSNISRVFWPPKARRETLREAVDSRGSELRKRFAIDDNSPLFLRDIRDDFEHFDERIDHWYECSENHNVVDRNFVPESQFGGLEKADILRNFDPAGMNLYFASHKLNIDEVADAVRELKKRLSADHVPMVSSENHVS